jgi:hypothetical protein
MTIDPGEPEPRPKSPDLWHLPDVIDVEIRRRRFDPPRRVTTAGVDREVRLAVEVAVQVSDPFVIRALGPVLWIGDQPLTTAEGDGDVTYRFFSFEPQTLPPGAPISLAWNSVNAPRKETRFRYEPPPQ